MDLLERKPRLLSQKGLDFISNLVRTEPAHRMTAAEALEHPFIRLKSKRQRPPPPTPYDMAIEDHNKARKETETEKRKEKDREEVIVADKRKERDREEAENHVMESNEY